MLDEPMVARTTWRPRGDHRTVLLVRADSVPERWFRTDRTIDGGALTEKLEVALAPYKLVKADVGFDCDTRGRIG